VRHTSGPLAVVLALIGAIGCTSPDDGRTADVRHGDVRAHTVAGVTLEVPDDLTREDVEPAADEVVAIARFTAGPQQVRSVQVLVGCGDAAAEDLVHATLTQPRESLALTAAEDARGVDVPGLDEAWATVLTYGAGRADDADTLRTAGLYGAGSGALVVIEFTTSTPSFDRARADALLASVSVDADELATACG
jgi:hypothetical protein